MGGGASVNPSLTLRVSKSAVVVAPTDASARDWQTSGTGHIPRVKRLALTDAPKRSGGKVFRRETNSFPAGVGKDFLI